MKRHSAAININLIPQDPFFDTIIGKTLKWALSIGRYIVIFTELVVIISFATRFTLDRQVTDLNDSINQKESIITSYGDLETQVRDAQRKIDQYQQIEQQTNIVDIFPALSAITPQDIQLSELTIKPTSVALAGSSLSNNSLNLLINNIQLSDKFFNVTVDRIETNPDQGPGFFFRLRADTVETQTTKSPTTTTGKTNILDRTQGL